MRAENRLVYDQQMVLKNSQRSNGRAPEPMQGALFQAQRTPPVQMINAP